MSELPYEFDLHYDVKTLQDIEAVIAHSHNSSATASDLRQLFLELDLQLPICLQNVTPTFEESVFEIAFGKGAFYESYTKEEVLEKLRRKVSA